MNEDYDYDGETHRFEYIGIAKVRFNAQGKTTVAVYKDHQDKCMHLRPVPFGTPSLAWIPHYDEEENDKLWEQINAHKRKGQKPRPTARFMTRRTNRNLKPTSRFITRASAPTGLPEIKPRSPSERSTKKVSIAEVSAMIAKEMDDIFGGDSE